MYVTQEVTITLGESELGAIALQYDCADCRQSTDINPYFYAEAGTPTCGECGDDMALIGADVAINYSKEV